MPAQVQRWNHTKTRTGSVPYSTINIIAQCIVKQYSNTRRKKIDSYIYRSMTLHLRHGRNTVTSTVTIDFYHSRG